MNFRSKAEIAGARALLGRDLQASYRPGIVAEQDFIIREDADDLDRLEKICRA
jgi:hypothetical protein